MKHLKTTGLLLFFLILSKSLYAQGPPITGDKPIMLGPKNFMIKTLTEVRKMDKGIAVNAPIIMHYLPTSNSLIGIHIPFVFYDFGDQEQRSGKTMGDILLTGKYQFYRKDGIGKTLRAVVKTVQNLGSGKDLDLESISTGNYQSYFGVVLGYESLKYGISNELGYNITADNNQNELKYKLGFGLPLLKPTYPVNQLNLYFEYQSSWYTETKDYALYSTQGIQYAIGKLTFEVAIQFPLVQNVRESNQRNHSWFFGTRYIL